MQAPIVRQSAADLVHGLAAKLKRFRQLSVVQAGRNLCQPLKNAVRDSSHKPGRYTPSKIGLQAGWVNFGTCRPSVVTLALRASG